MSSSEMRKRKKKRTYTEEDLRKALNEIREKKKSVRQICKEYAIPKTTILDKISGRRPDGVKKPGPVPGLGVDGEKKVVEWLLNISKCGFLSNTLVKVLQNEKKKIHPLQEVSNNTVDVELNVQCPECNDVPISDVEDDDEKNVGCDKCIRWYLEAKDKSFEWDLCH